MLLLVFLSVLLSISDVQTKIASFITDSVNSKFGTSIQVERIDLSSLKTVKLKNVLIRDHHQDTLIFAGSLNTSLLNIRGMLKANLELGEIELEDGKFLMRTYKGEDTNNLTLFVDKFDNGESEDANVFKLSSSSIYLNNVDFILTDENKQSDPIVFYKKIKGFFDDFELVGSNVKSYIHDLQLYENHDITVTKWNTEFSYSNTKMEFLNTELQTEYSDLKANIIFNYNEGDLSYFTDKVIIDADIQNADIALIDLKKFYNEFGTKDKIHFSTVVKGTVNDFDLKDINLKSDRKTILKGNMSFKNVLKSDKFNLEGKIKKFSSSRDNLVKMLPKLLEKKLPASLDKFGKFSASGDIKLTRANILTKLKIWSELGEGTVDLQLADLDQKNRTSYKGKIDLVDFDLGKFANDSLIGKLSMVGEIDGKGFSIENMDSKITGHVSKHQYKGYTYSNIDINGVFRDKHFNGELLVNDPNIILTFKGLADFSSEKYIFDFNADVTFADFLELNLFTKHERSILRGKIDMNLVGSNVDNIEGEMKFKDAVYINQNNIFSFKDFYINSTRKDSVREIVINSTDIINGKVRGDFKFKELGKLAENSLGSLFANYQKTEVSEGQYVDFRFNIYNKIIEVFYPKVNLGTNTYIKGEVDSDKDKFELVIKSPKIEAFDVIIDDIDLQINNKNPLFNTLLNVGKIDSKFYKISDVNLVNIVLNDTLFMRTSFEGGVDKTESFDFSFYQTINENKQVVLGIKKSDIIFKNNTWNINPENNQQNKVVFDDDFKTFAIDNINMVSGKQHIDLAGAVGNSKNRNIDLKFENVNLYDVTPAIDSVKVDGKINGSLRLKTVNNQTLPYADLTINYFSINDDYYGDLTLKAESDVSNKVYSFDLELINSDLLNFIGKGSVNFGTASPTIIASVEFDKFKMNAFSPLGKDVLKNIRGYATGNVSITGLLSNPNIDGQLNLLDAGIEFPYLNVNYNFLGNTSVKLYDQTFEFEPINIEDEVMKSKGVISGKISHTGFSKWYMDLGLSSDNLLVLNTKAHEDALYYGVGLLGGKTTIKGFTDKLVINVTGTTNKGTEFVIPLSDVSQVNESKLIHFTNVEEIEEDENETKEIVFKELKGLSINFDLKVTKDAVAEIVIDKITGSLLRGSADGNLKLNIETNGKFEMYGNLKVDNGEYLFKNIVTKEFKVVKGGTITWDGNPTEANLNIDALYHTRANPSVLLDEIASSRKIDVELKTSIIGNLSNPEFKFDVLIPKASSLVASELEFKLKDEDDKLNQFISLLVTGSFSSQNNEKTNFNSNQAIAGAIAQKASQLMSNMLGSENDNFQVGVTYDIGTSNSVQDVNTDDQLGVEVSGRIADKVIVNGKVGVPIGSNTNSNIIGEVEIIVPLNEAETFQAKVYNKQNEIQFTVAEGEGYTQGIGISYQFNFDNSKEFFEKVGLRKTEEEKLMTKEQRDSVKKERRVFKRKEKESKKKVKQKNNP